MIVRGGERAVEPNCSLETLHRFVGPLRVQQCHSKIAVRFRVARQQARRVLHRQKGLRVVSRPPEQSAESLPARSIAWKRRRQCPGQNHRVGIALLRDHGLQRIELPALVARIAAPR